MTDSIAQTEPNGNREALKLALRLQALLEPAKHTGHKQQARELAAELVRRLTVETIEKRGEAKRPLKIACYNCNLAESCYTRITVGKPPDWTCFTPISKGETA